MRKILLVFCVMFLFIAGCTAAQKANPDSDTKDVTQLTYRQISEKEALDFMVTADTDYIILDVRTVEEFSQGHIEGAICIPNETIGTAPIEELPDKDALIMVYCRSGNRSKQASEKLVALGYTNIVEFGGIINWEGETVTG